MTALRVLAGALLVANLGYFIWTQGGFALFGTLPARFTENEPQRIAQQVRPQLLRIVNDEAVATKP